LQPRPDPDQEASVSDPEKTGVLEVLTASLSDEWQAMIGHAPRIVAAVVVFALFLLAGKLIGRGLAAVLRRGDFTPVYQVFFRRLAVWLAGLLGLAVAMNLLGLGGAAAGLLAGGGLTAVILGFAFREIGENLLAGLFLAFSRPFKVGDQIESGGFKGTVRSIELRYTHIRTLDGRDIYIPNALIFKDPLINYTRDGLLRDSFTVGVDYGDDVGAAARLLLDTVSGVAGVLKDPAPSSEALSLGPTWVDLEVHYWVDTFRASPGMAAVRGAVLDRCRRALLDGGYTLSSDTVSRLAVAVRQEPASPA
jgi:small-conductance mechanosensitive channel